MAVSVMRFSGFEAEPYMQELARLRIEVFREFPYLYDGSIEYERRYLRTYLGVADSVIVVAFDGDRVIGVSTGLPMTNETDEVKKPFIENGYHPEKVFYFGESVLERDFRGKGLGVRFFDEREAHVKSLEVFGWTCFCAVERALDHPRRPPDYVPLDHFWNKRGYTKQENLRTTFTWQDLDEANGSPKPMAFWLKKLR